MRKRFRKEASKFLNFPLIEYFSNVIFAQTHTVVPPIVPSTLTLCFEVIAPYSSEDAKGLLKAAIRDDNPGVF